MLTRIKGNELSLNRQALTHLLKAVLEKGIPFRFRAKGFSMTPFVRDGDVITIFPLSGNLPRIGDVVAYTQLKTNILKVHRVVGKKGEYFLVKADNSFSRNCEFVPKTKVLGLLHKVEREGNDIYLGLGPERIIIALAPQLMQLYFHFVRLCNNYYKFLKG